MLAQFPSAKIHLEDAESELPRKMLSLWHGENPTVRECITRIKPTQSQLGDNSIQLLYPQRLVQGPTFLERRTGCPLPSFLKVSNLGHMNQFNDSGDFLSIERELTELEDLQERPSMKSVRFLVFRVLLLIAFLTTYLYFLYGQEHEHGVPIARNAAWNDLVRQIDPSSDDSPRDTLGKEILLIQNFLREHQSEVTVGIYDIAVFRAIDQVRARLQKADKDLETIRNELSYKEYQAKGGR